MERRTAAPGARCSCRPSWPPCTRLGCMRSPQRRSHHLRLQPPPARANSLVPAAGTELAQTCRVRLGGAWKWAPASQGRLCMRAGPCLPLDLWMPPSGFEKCQCPVQLPLMERLPPMCCLPITSAPSPMAVELAQVAEAAGALELREGRLVVEADSAFMKQLLVQAALSQLHSGGSTAPT